MSEITNAELKKMIIADFCYQFDLDNIEMVEFFTWLIWALGLTNS